MIVVRGQRRWCRHMKARQRMSHVWMNEREATARVVGVIAEATREVSLRVSSLTGETARPNVPSRAQKMLLRHAQTARGCQTSALEEVCLAHSWRFACTRTQGTNDFEREAIQVARTTGATRCRPEEELSGVSAVTSQSNRNVCFASATSCPGPFPSSLPLPLPPTSVPSVFPLLARTGLISRVTLLSA